MDLSECSFDYSDKPTCFESLFRSSSQMDQEIVKNKRDFKGIASIALIIVSVMMVLYHMLSAQFLLIGSVEHQNIHLTFIAQVRDYICI